MTDLIYCGAPPVGQEATQALLAGPFRALWSPPMHRHAAPAAGDRVWLVWRGSTHDSTFLLGGGIIDATDEGKVDWTNRTAPGIVDAARLAGYGGPTNMAFLRLTHVRIPPAPVRVDLGSVTIGLSELTAEQSTILGKTLPLE